MRRVRGGVVKWLRLLLLQPNPAQRRKKGRGRGGGQKETRGVRR
jgi:hypothetical protein